MAATIKVFNGLVLRSVKKHNALDIALVKAKNGLLGPTYCVWDGANKSAGITLSNGNKTATKASGASWEIGRGTIGVSTGKWAWEFTGTFAGSLSIGICNSSQSFAGGAALGGDANGWGYSKVEGNKIINGTSTAYGAAYAGTNTIRVELNMDAGTLVMFKDNVSQGTMATGLTGTIYPAYSINTTTDAVVANFGQSAFANAPSAGFQAGIWA